jgi:KEOPS complex subunit Cgi121
VRFVEGVATVEDVDAFVGAVGSVADETDATVQVFDARYVAGETHLRTAPSDEERTSPATGRLRFCCTPPVGGR